MSMKKIAMILSAMALCSASAGELPIIEQDAPAPELAIIDQAVLLQRQGLYGEAEMAYDVLLEEWPQSMYRPQALKGLADIAMAQADYKTAAELYAKVPVAALTTDDAAAVNLCRGICAWELRTVDGDGSGEAARPYLTKASLDKTTRSAAMFYLGVIDYNKGNYGAARRYFEQVNTAEKPGDLTDLYLASIDYAEGNYAKALATARQMLRRPGLSARTTAELNRLVGESLYRQGQHADAVPYLEKYISVYGVEPAVEGSADVRYSLTPAQPSAMYIVGLYKFKQGDYDGALELMEQVAKRDDGALRQAAYLYIGQCRLELGDTEAAILAFDKAARDDYDSAVREAAFYNYAAAKYAGASVPFASSAETFEEFLRLYPDGPYSERVAAYLAHGYMADADYERALQRINAIANPSEPLLAAKQRVLYTIGNTALRRGDGNEAYRMLKQAEELAKYDPEIAAETQLALAQLALSQKDYKTAIAKYRTYLANPGRTNAAVANYGLAYAYYGAGDATAAERYFKQVQMPDAYNRLGDIAFARGDFEGAYKNYMLSYDMDHQSGDYAMLNAAKMRGYQRKYKDKLDILNDFTARFSTSVLMPDALLEMTQAQISMGRNADAIDTYRRIIADYPTTAQGRRGYLQMAMTLLDMERDDEAAAAYREVIERYPSSDEAAQAAQILKTIYSEDVLADMPVPTPAPKATPNISEDTIIEKYPDTRAAEEALAAKARREYAADHLPEALDLYEQLVVRASDPALAAEARIGVMRTARDMADYERAGSAADAIIASSVAGDAVAEARFTKALALDDAGKKAEALAIWRDLAKTPADVYGARSAYEAASALYQAEQYADALAAAQAFVKAGSPQRYWVARAFILISDIYKAQGKDLEAKEYLEALRDNYPGKEADIFMMIESRM